MEKCCICSRFVTKQNENQHVEWSGNIVCEKCLDWYWEEFDNFVDKKLETFRELKQKY